MKLYREQSPQAEGHKDLRRGLQKSMVRQRTALIASPISSIINDPGTQMMTITRLKFLLSLLLCLAASEFSYGEVRQSGQLELAELKAIKWYSIDSEQPGPTVLITGGIHGNEPAGAAAAEQIRHWPIKRGKIVVIPKINQLGLKADSRWLPQHRNDKKLRDLNRNFPKEEGSFPQGEIATAIWNFTQSLEPDYVIDLHEGFDFHSINPKSVGSSIIFSPGKHRADLASSMLQAVNTTIVDEKKHLVPLSRSGAVPGSLVRSCHELLGVHGFILETTFKEQPLSLRTRQHRIMVSSLLQSLGVIDTDLRDQLGIPETPDVIRIGMFDGAGASANGIKNFHRLFDEREQFHLTHVGPSDMKEDVLKQFDVLLFPGGSGSKQGKDIGAAGRDAIRHFAKEGGGLIGVCAGAYLCSSHYDWSLNVINTTVFNKMVDVPGVGRKSMWYRGGKNSIDIEFTHEASEILGQTGLTQVTYQNGPIVSVGKNSELPEWTTLAWFRSEVSKYDAQKGTMVNTPAIITATFGDGRVVCVSPHPEATPGLESVILNAIQYVANREKISQ